MSLANHPDDFFEGPEKRVEIDFAYNKCHPQGLRVISDETWSEVLTLANCSIISSMKGPYFTAYVLSESSLFVYPHKVIIKTCGTTTLLLCVQRIVELAQEILDTTVTFLMFSRKNFIRPHLQPYPHCSFDTEVEFLNGLFDEDGREFVVGPESGDHWHIYVIDNTIPGERHPDLPCDVTLEILMHDLDPEIMQQFFKTPSFESTERVSYESGISSILPGSRIDAYMFDPCGYSMNGIYHDKYYWTIHVTPEDAFSFVSFEMNVPMEDCSELVQTVLETFRPRRYSVTALKDIISTTYDVRHRPVSPVAKHHRKSNFVRETSFTLEGGLNVRMWSQW